MTADVLFGTAFMLSPFQPASRSPTSCTLNVDHSREHDTVLALFGAEAAAAVTATAVIPTSARM